MVKIEDLVIEAKQGNKDSFTKLILSIRPDLLRIAKSRLGNDDDSEDALQEAITIAYLNINNLENPSSFKSWITKILINECNRIHRRKKGDAELINNLPDNFNLEDIDCNINFDEMIKVLNKKDQQIFQLYFQDGFTIKQISKILGIKENTIKTNLNRGKLKIKRTYKPATIAMFILFVFIATSVIAVSIISYIKSLFELDSMGLSNDGVLTAIENSDWFQKTDMEYIDLGDGYEVRLEYLVMDEMNLYMVYDIKSEKDISKYTDVYFPDLKIVDENGEVICNEENVLAEQYNKKLITKTIDCNKNYNKVLVVLYTDSFPASSKLNITFSNIQLVKDVHNIININSNVNFDITLSEKFTDREHTYFTANSDIVEKAVISETGFYAIINATNSEAMSVSLIDENGISYECFVQSLTDNNLKSIIISNYNNTDIIYLKLIVDGKEFKLTKNN